VETISASQFRRRCLSLIETVTPEGILITKRGKAVARLVPITGPCAGLIGMLKGKIGIKGSLLPTGVHWDAQR